MNGTELSAISAIHQAQQLTMEATLVHFEPGEQYYRKMLRERIGKLRAALDEVETFLDKADPKGVAK